MCRSKAHMQEQAKTQQQNSHNEILTDVCRLEPTTYSTFSS